MLTSMVCGLLTGASLAAEYQPWTSLSRWAGNGASLCTDDELGSGNPSCDGRLDNERDVGYLFDAALPDSL